VPLAQGSFPAWILAYLSLNLAWTSDDHHQHNSTQGPKMANLGCIIDHYHIHFQARAVIFHGDLRNKEVSMPIPPSSLFPAALPLLNKAVPRTRPTGGLR
jgi:hypothetical protein